MAGLGPKKLWRGMLAAMLLGSVSLASAQDHLASGSAGDALEAQPEPKPVDQGHVQMRGEFVPGEDAPETSQPGGSDPVTIEEGPSEIDDFVAPPPAPKPPEPTPFPELPDPPVLGDVAYPECRDGHEAIVGPYESADAVNRCILDLDTFRLDTLSPFRRAMSDYQARIAMIYITEVSDDRRYTEAQRREFYEEIGRRNEQASVDGELLAQYRELDNRYEQDRTYLDDRFCYYTGCAGYPAPELVRERPKPQRQERVVEREETRERKEKRAERDKNCKAERKGGGLLGGILGGVVGGSTGLGKLGSALVGAAAGSLLGELACQLTGDEQEKAVEATETVLAKKEVGATAIWRSDSRENVSGSSTVTALNSEPNGATCMNIIDVVIIDGEESRASKRMCRQPGEGRYVIQA